MLGGDLSHHVDAVTSLGGGGELAPLTVQTEQPSQLPSRTEAVPSA